MAPTPANWQRAKRIFGQLPQKPVLIWNDGPRMRRLIEQLIESDLDPGPDRQGPEPLALLRVCAGQRKIPHGGRA